MAKPAQQWETRQHRALREPGRPERLAADPRAEAFVLEFADGRLGAAECGLAVQYVDEQGASDPDLVQAVSAWLIARGVRAINLRRASDEQALAVGPIGPEQLGVGLEHDHAGPLISICPSNAEAIWALGCFDRVIACEDSSDFPPEVAALERLGPDLGPDLDRIAQLCQERGALVISSLSVPGMERNVTGLHARGVAQLVLAPRSIADVLAELARLGRVLGAEQQAAAVIAGMREQIEALQRAAAGRRPARVYLEWWPRPMFSPGADCYSNELIALAGGVNVFAERPGSSLQISVEELLAADPELCFISWCGVAADKLDVRRLIERPGLEALPAARAGRVFPLDERFSGRPGPRMLEAARVMAERIARLVDGLDGAG